MIIDHRRLNDNTIDDAYDIPDKSELINNIQGNKIFSKFDCKRRIWHIKMHSDSIEWTAFTCPLGHYERLVMVFGLKNTSCVFQKKMDDILGKFRKFACA